MAPHDDAPSASTPGGGPPDADEAAAPCETPDELLAWAREYAAEVVAANGLAVDLSLVDWTVSHRAKRRAGAVRGTRPPGATVGDPIDWSAVDDSHRECTVSLTWRAYEVLGHEAMAGTVRHELVHVEQWQRYGRTNHGAEFERRATDLDAPLSCDSFTPAPYLVECDDCGALVARRYRRSKLVTRSKAYRSRCCGGSLTVRENPEAD